MAFELRSMFAATLSLLASLIVTSAFAQGPEAPIWPTQQWLTSTPEEQGMDSSALAKLVDEGESQSRDSLLIVRHGRIVLDAYYAPYTENIPHNIFSSTKAVTGTLMAMVLKDGLLDSFDHPVVDFFADRAIANLDDRKRAITVQNLLDMTSGLDWDQGFEGGKQQSMFDLYRASNWTQFILDRSMAHAPGEVYNYNNGNPDLVSAIITRLTGKLAEAYARQRLFAPLGIVDWHWDRDPQGLTQGEGMLYLKPRDMAKLGYLYLHHGEWEGRQLLPEGYADVLDHKLVNMSASYDPTQSYSDFFWVYPDLRAFQMNGKNGQLITILPDQDIVAVTTARKQARLKNLIATIAGAVKSETALPPNPEAAEKLADAIRRAETEKPASVGPTPEIAAAASAKLYKFPDNELGLKSFRLDLIGTRPGFEYEVALRWPVGSSVSYALPLGLDGYYRRASPKLFDPGIGLTPAARGTWETPSTFVIDTPLVGYGEQRKLILTFKDRKLNLRLTTAVGEGPEGSVEGEQSE